MAIYFLNLKSLGRATGSSSVSAAAYRAGERIKDERTGRTYDHSGRQDVLHKAIMLPNRFAGEKMSWANDRSNLWNTAERAEVRSDARTAREYLVALPAELSPQARINLVTKFSRELVERYQFALDIAIHAPRDYPGSDPRNFHAHLLATTREVTPTGLGAKTTLEWSDTHRRQMGLGSAVGELLYVREHWATVANTALAQEHINARIDHRTLKAQGIDREPKPHIPHVAFEMERHGYRSVVAERIRADYQARVEARLQRAAQHERPIAAPKSLVHRAKEYALRWLGYRQAEAQPKSPEVMAKDSVQKGQGYRHAHKEAQPKIPEDQAKKSALKWAARYEQAHEKSPRDAAMEAALRWKAQYGQGHEKSSRDVAMEAALRWKAQYGQAHHKSPEDLAKESAMRWLRYRQQQLQEKAEGQAPAKERVPKRAREAEREQAGPAPPSAERSRDYDGLYL
jgi:ATP-dependent exoDNAse (exonuclease V) alpha subunit